MTDKIVQTKDLRAFELIPGLAARLSASLDRSYIEYAAASLSGRSTREAESRIAVIPEEKRYLTRVLESLDNAFADFDSYAAKLDLPYMRNRQPEAIRFYLQIRLQQCKMLLAEIENYMAGK